MTIDCEGTQFMEKVTTVRNQLQSCAKKTQKEKENIDKLRDNM